MKAKAHKIAELENLKTVFAENPVVVVCSFQGIKVADDFQLRSKIRGAGASYRVISNRLVGLAAEGIPGSQALTGLKGMTALAYAKDDPVGLVKTLIAYSKENPVFSFRAGLIEGQPLDAKSVEAVSKMPSKQEVQAKVLFLINAPATNLVRQINAPAQNLVGVLNAPARDLVSVLKQAVDQEKFK